VCKRAYFFPFTDVRNGPPQKSCFNDIIEDYTAFKGTYKRYATAFIASAMVIFITWFTSFGVSFRMKWDHRGSPLTFGYVIKKITDETNTTEVSATKA
jgi:hypothetical protein